MISLKDMKFDEHGGASKKKESTLKGKQYGVFSREREREADAAGAVGGFVDGVKTSCVKNETDELIGC